MPSAVATGLSLGANVGVLASITVGFEFVKVAVLYVAHRCKVI